MRMTDIKPFYHIKNFKDGVSDAISKGVFDTSPRSPEYKEGYDFGIKLNKNNAEYIRFLKQENKIIGDLANKIYERVK